MKKYALSFLSIGLIFSLTSNTTFASGESKEIEDAEEILVDFGYEKDDLNYYNDENIIELADTVVNDPDNLEMNTTYLRVDNVGIIEYYANISDEELIENGSSAEEVNLIREKLELLDKQPIEEIKENYDLSNGEALLIKSALEVDPDYTQPESFDNKEVTTSAEIASSKLSFTQSVVNKSTTKAPKYQVTLNHKWKTPFFFDIVSDNVAASWGGGLDVKDISGLVFYNKGDWYSGKFGAGIGSVKPSSTVTPNKGLVYSFKQKLTGRNQAMAGTYNFTVFQTKKAGKSTSLVSQYAHKKATVSNVSISSTPGITIGSSKDVSPQKKNNITY